MQEREELELIFHGLTGSNSMQTPMKQSLCIFFGMWGGKTAFPILLNVYTFVDN